MLMAKFRLLAIIALVTLEGCAAKDPASLREIVVQEVLALQTDSNYQAVSGAIFLNGESFQFHYGVLPDGQTPDTNTLYEIGSLTKTYTGLLLAQAIEDGKLELNAPVANYLNNFSADHFSKEGRDATIRDLAAHTSGLSVNIACNNPDLTTAAKVECYQGHDRVTFFQKLQETSLLDKPGERYRYSNAGIRLLSHIIEDAYTLPYQELLQTYVFSLSGEEDTLFRLGIDDTNRLAVGRDQTGQLMPNASEYYFGAGALKTTTDSFLKYMALYLENPKSVTQRAITLIAGDTDGLGRAYVWNTFRYDSEGMLYHAGGTFGTSSWVALYPRENLGIFLVTPLTSPDAQQRLNEASNKIVDRLRKMIVFSD